MNLKGSYVALVTPFHADGSVNLEKLRELCEWHIQEGTDGLVPLGTTGEASTLTQQEQDAVAQCVIDTVAGRVPVIVGAGSNATAVSVQKARHYAQMGADGVLAITPYYNKANEEGMVRHFETIADAAGVPVVMYNVPGRTACSLSVQAVERLSRHPNIAGIKEREFKRGLQRRIELLCNIFAVLGRPMYDWRSVRVTFKRALPQNLLELSQTLSNLGTLLSDETKRALLPLEIDEAAEAERIAGQRESNMSLFNFSHADEEDGGVDVDGA